MAKSKQKGPGRGWFTKAEAAATFNVSEAYFDRDYRKLAPAGAVKDIDGRLWFRTREIIDALVKTRVAEERERARVDAGDGPLMIGANTPWMEALREENTLIRRMERKKMEGTLVPRDTLDPALGQMAWVLRQMGEGIQNKFGADGAVVVEMALRRIGEIWERSFNGRIVEQPVEDAGEASSDAASGDGGGGGADGVAHRGAPDVSGTAANAGDVADAPPTNAPGVC